MDTKRLYLEFLDDAGNTVTISLDDPKADLDTMTINSNMQAIINANCIDNKGQDLAEIKGAYVIEQTKTAFI